MLRRLSRTAAKPAANHRADDDIDAGQASRHARLGDCAAMTTATSQMRVAKREEQQTMTGTTTSAATTTVDVRDHLAAVVYLMKRRAVSALAVVRGVRPGGIYQRG